MNTIQQLFGLNAPLVHYSVLQLDRAALIHPDLVCGVELEIENVGDFDHARDIVNRTLWNVVEDGSLRPRGSSWEFVSNPMPMDSLVAELAVFFRNNRFTVDNYSDRTSVHVHTNVQDFTPEQLSSLALVYTTVEDVIFEFINNYNKGDLESYYRDTNLYCIPWTHSRQTFEIVRKFFTEICATAKYWEKYTALNLQPIRTQGTVEWRHMHGTNDMDKLRKWLNIIGSIMKYAQSTNFADLVKTIESLNDTSAYRQYFNNVLGGTLMYDDAYARRMSEGVINAKYALINRDSKKQEEKLSEWDRILRRDQEAMAEIQAAHARLRRGAVAGNPAARVEPQRPVRAAVPQPEQVAQPLDIDWILDDGNQGTNRENG